LIAEAAPIDEAQNLTPHEVKTIISRAGDIQQIDQPYRRAW
jgi:predicted ribonuclease YlaK